MNNTLTDELQIFEQYLEELKAYKPNSRAPKKEDTPMHKIATMFKSLSSHIEKDNFLDSGTFFMALQIYLLAEQYKQKLVFLGGNAVNSYASDMETCDVAKNFASGVLQNTSHICFRELAQPGSVGNPFLIPNSLLQSLFMLNDIDAIVDIWKNFFKPRIKNHHFIAIVEEEISTLQGFRGNLAYDVGI